MELEQKPTGRPMNQNRRSIHKPTQLQQTDLQEKHTMILKHMMNKEQSLQQMLLGKLNIHMQKTETRSLPLTLYQNQLKLDERF
jgi:hypothetical protein